MQLTADIHIDIITLNRRYQLTASRINTNIIISYRYKYKLTIIYWADIDKYKMIIRSSYHIIDTNQQRTDTNK